MRFRPGRRRGVGGRAGGGAVNDRHTADDRDDLAREQRQRQREREEYLTEEKETYGTED